MLTKKIDTNDYAGKFIDFIGLTVASFCPTLPLDRSSGFSIVSDYQSLIVNLYRLYRAYQKREK